MDIPRDSTLIALASTDAEIARCFPVMSELRPHLKAEQFPARVKAQQEAGYLLAYLEDAGEVQSVAGFRIGDNLAWGHFLYVDDLVTRDSARSRGYGEALFDWLVQYALENNCECVQLDSGVQRFRAHQFYLRKKMIISSHHFSLALESASG